MLHILFSADKSSSLSNQSVNEDQSELGRVLHSDANSYSRMHPLALGGQALWK